MKSNPLVFIINRLAVGGAEHVLIEDVNELIARGEDVYLITLRPEKEKTLSSICDISSDRWILVNFNTLFHISAWLRFIRTLRKVKPKALISHLWFANFITRIGGVLAGVKCRIIFEQNVYDESKSKKT